ncbi:MAG: hypothetical protein C4312_00300, partial [Thermoflexus sp.]
RGEPAVRPRVPPAAPLPLFVEHPVIHALRRLDPESLSPLEALHKLYELRGLLEEGADRQMSAEPGKDPA